MAEHNPKIKVTVFLQGLRFDLIMSRNQLKHLRTSMSTYHLSDSQPMELLTYPYGEDSSLTFLPSQVQAVIYEKVQQE